MKTFKKIKYLLALILTISMNVCFGQSVADIFNSSGTPITWMGLDFSEVRYIGDAGTVNAMEMKDLTQKINHLMIKEKKKYDVGDAFNKNQVTDYFTVTNRLNENLDATNILSSASADYTRFKAENIEKECVGQKNKKNFKFFENLFVICFQFYQCFYNFCISVIRINF